MEKSDEMYPHLDMRSRRGEGEYCGLSDSRAGAVSYARAGVERRRLASAAATARRSIPSRIGTSAADTRGHVRDGLEDTDEDEREGMEARNVNWNE